MGVHSSRRASGAYTVAPCSRPRSTSRRACRLRCSQVQHLRQILLWPLRLVALRRGDDVQRRPWELLGADSAGESLAARGRRIHRRARALPGAPLQRVRHLPALRAAVPLRRGPRARHGGARRRIADARVPPRRRARGARAAARRRSAPFTLQVVHVDLYFFYDIDVVLLNVEVARRRPALARCAGDAVPLRPRLPGRLGRGRPGRCTAMASVEWLDADGAVLARSDAQAARARSCAFVGEHRAPRIAAHWAFLLEPLVPDHSERRGPAALPPDRVLPHAADGVPRGRRSARADAQRLRPPGPGHRRRRRANLPFAEQHLADFEQRYCYDRFWADAGAAPSTRYLCCGHALVVVGDARVAVLPLPRPRRAGAVPPPALPAVPDRALPEGGAADVLRPPGRCAEAPRRRATPRACAASSARSASSFEVFLRFTHRYWFHEVSEQAQVRALFRMCTTHLGLDPLYAEVKERIARHERLSRRRQPAPPGQHRGAADGGDDLRPDRHGDHRLPRHEPAGRGRARRCGCACWCSAWCSSPRRR